MEGKRVTIQSELISDIESSIESAINNATIVGDEIIRYNNEYIEKMKNLRNTQYMLIGEIKSSINIYKNVAKKYNYEIKNFDDKIKNIKISNID